MKNSVKNSAAILMISAIVLLSGCRGKGIPTRAQQTLDQYIAYWNTGKFDDIEKVMAEDFELIESPGFEPRQGIDYFKKMISNTRITYPDFRLEINETVYEKDKVALIWTVTGTNKGPGEIPPTGRTIKGKSISVIHFRDGKIKDEWLGNNNLMWLMQLGYKVVPPVPEASRAK
jgi:steroid delta-isomerase-like uncharacterized protein